MILFDNHTNIKIDEEILGFLESIANDLTKQNIELLLVENSEITELNAAFLGKNYATDVLSFPLDFSEIKSDDNKTKMQNIDSSDFTMLGSIVISLEMAQQVAESYNHSLKDELAILFTHGLLHLLGFNHECDNGEHRAKEREILGKFHIKSLIERNCD